MTFTQPLALLWLLAVPAVVALHLFRRQLRERRVAAAFLFADARLVADAGRRRTRLLRTPSLWLECLAAATLATWLAGPSFGGKAARHVVFVLDDSASMSAGAAERAAVVVRQRAGELSGGDRATVLRTGERPDVLVGPAALPQDVGPALAGWQPARPRHDPTPALDLARELAGTGGEVVFCTDEAPPPRCTDIDVLAFGRTAANCAILSTRRTHTADGEVLAARVGGYGAVASATLAVSAVGVELTRSRIDLEAGVGDVSLRLPPDTGIVHLQLDPDGLRIDDEAWLLPPPERTVLVCDLLPAERRESLQLPRVFAAQRGWRTVSDPSLAQLVVTAEPGTLRPGQIEFVVAPGDGEVETWRGPFVVDRAHDLLAGVRLQGVVWSARKRALPGRVLVAVGSQALLSEEALDAGRRLWLDLDPAVGNVVRSPDWPVAWANLLEAARAEAPGVEEVEVFVGREARYRRSMLAGADDREVTLLAPDGVRTPGRGQRTVGFVPTRPGVHRLLGVGGRDIGAFAARFLDPAESDLRAAVTGEWSRAAAPREHGPVRDRDIERRLLGLALLAFVLADWWLLAGGRWRRA